MSTYVRRRLGGVSGSIVFGSAERPGVPKVLGYALPPKDPKRAIVEFDDMDLYDLPLGSPESFLDYSAVVVYAGAFEIFTGHDGRLCDVRSATYDLDRRDREAHTMGQKGIPLILLVPSIPQRLENRPVPETADLFRRLMSTLPMEWELLPKPVANLKALVPEFAELIQKHGVANVAFVPTLAYTGQATVIAELGAIYAFCMGPNLFFLPSHMPHNHDDACAIAALAARCVLAYRQRISTEMPGWVDDFRFQCENALRAEAEVHRLALSKLEAGIESYTARKVALCYKSDPLVKVIVSILREVFELQVKTEDKRIEDAAIVDENGNVLAVVEIKGESGSFKREHVNQVDSHRERLNLPAKTRGLLIMNTNMKASSLAEKDEAPHPDIIAKAVAENVLMMRTLDLLRYADLVEQGMRSRADFRNDIFTNAGWLRVEDGAVQVVKGSR